MFRSSSKPIPAAAVTASTIVTLFAGAAGEPPGGARRGKFRMTPFQPLLIAAACTLALAACASAPPVYETSAPPAYETSAPPPEDTTGFGQSAATGGSAYGAVNTSGTYPYGTIHKVGVGVPQQAAAEATGEVVVMGPDGTVWVQSGGADARHQSDLDSCYFYAQGQVAHDARIESDVNAAFQSEAGGLGLAALRGRMNNFERTRRVPSLFSSCMAAKGYSSQ